MTTASNSHKGDFGRVLDWASEVLTSLLEQGRSRGVTFVSWTPARYAALARPCQQQLMSAAAPPQPPQVECLSRPVSAVHVRTCRKQHQSCFIEVGMCLMSGLVLWYPTAQDVQQNTAQNSAAQHSTAQHSTAQHSTAQHSATQHSMLTLVMGMNCPFRWIPPFCSCECLATCLCSTCAAAAADDLRMETSGSSKYVITWSLTNSSRLNCPKSKVPRVSRATRMRAGPCSSPAQQGKLGAVIYSEFGLQNRQARASLK